MIQNDKVCDTAYGDFGGYVVLGAMEVVRTPSSRATRILAVDAKVKDGGKGGSRPTGMKAFIQGVRSSETSQWRDQRDPGQWSRFVGLTLELWRCWGTKTSVLRDAQGRKMQGGKLRQASVVIQDDTLCASERPSPSQMCRILFLHGAWKVGKAWIAP